MIINKDSITLFEQYQINLPESVLIKIEDGVRKDKELLVTIDASHYGFRNNNGTVYRHDTMKNDVQSFVYPKPRPIIERHRPDVSEVFGDIIAADYKITDYYDVLNNQFDIDGLSTEEYIEMCKEEILPLQMKDSRFNGLAFVQVVGKLNHKQGIKKVLDGEFLSVSIGANPKKLICSECLQDQTQRMCSHFVNKMSGRFMLAEELEYEELSFVPKPADPFGRVVKIHDGKMEEFKIEHDVNLLNTAVDVVYIKDFFQEAEGKTIVCVDNICTIINQEEQKMKRTISLADEFSTDVLKEALASIELKDEETDISELLKLDAEEAESWTARKFAIVQKDAEGDKRRFPLHDEINVRAGLALIDQAEDLTEAEIKKAKAKLEKAAVKFGIELQDAETETEEAVDTQDGVDTKLEDGEQDEKAAVAEEGAGVDQGVDAVEPMAIDTLLDSLKEELEKIDLSIDFKLEDGQLMTSEASNPKKDPVTKIFDLLKWYAADQSIAAHSLNAGITGFLEEAGKEAIAKGSYDELQANFTELDTKFKDSETKNVELTDEVQSLQDECEILEETAKDLNYELRVRLVDEIVCNKKVLGILADSEEDEAKQGLFKLSYDALKMQLDDSRKLTAKLKDSVNNKVDIDTIDNPTLQDSDLSGEKDTQSPAEEKQEGKRPSEEQLAKAIASLFKREA